MATSIMAMVMAALSSSVVLATKALPDPNSPTEKIVLSADALLRLTDELSQANSISALSSIDVRFNVADRDADGIDETINYAWSGTTGDELTRTLNDGGAISSISDVESFKLSPIFETQTLTYPGPIVDSAETAIESPVNINQYSQTVDTTTWFSQTITPSLTPTAVTWAVFAIDLNIASNNAATEQFRVQLRLSNADGSPSSYVIQDRLVSESSLFSWFQWTRISFIDPVRLHRDTPTVFVIGQDSGADPALNFMYSNIGSRLMMRSTDGGLTWSEMVGQTIDRSVTGSIGTPGVDMIYTRRYLTGMAIDVQPGPDPRAALRTSTPIVNRPELSATRYAIPFDSDPTALDINKSGVDDWTDVDGSAFDLGSIGGDSWTPTQTLELAEGNDFTEPTVLAVRMMTTTVGEGAFVSINADWSGGQHAELEAYLIKIKDGSQALMLEHRTSLSKTEPICLFGGLGSGYIELELLIDPNADTVRVIIDEVDKGTFGYVTIPSAHFEKVIRLGTRGAGAEIDAVDINVKEVH